MSNKKDINIMKIIDKFLDDFIEWNLEANDRNPSQPDILFEKADKLNKVLGHQIVLIGSYGEEVEIYDPEYGLICTLEFDGEESYNMEFTYSYPDDCEDDEFFNSMKKIFGDININKLGAVEVIKYIHDYLTKKEENENGQMPRL